MLKYNYTVSNLNAEVVDVSDRGDNYQRRTFKEKNCKGQKLTRRLCTLFVDQI